MKLPIREEFVDAITAAHVMPLALVAALIGAARAQTALPGTDIRSYLTADISAKLSLAGTWMPTGTTPWGSSDRTGT